MPDFDGSDDDGPGHEGPDHEGPDDNGPDDNGPVHAGPSHEGPGNGGLDGGSAAAGDAGREGRWVRRSATGAGLLTATLALCVVAATESDAGARLQPGPSHQPAASGGARGIDHDPAAMAGLGQARVLPYPMEFVWPTAMRYLRVDRGYTIVDRDPEAGFILFDFPIGPEDRVGRGSIEVFATKDASGRAAASVQITTDGGPLHLPHALLDGLAEKLRRERGQPAAPPRPEPPGPGPDTPKGKPKPRPGDEPDMRPEDLPILE